MACVAPSLSQQHHHQPKKPARKRKKPLSYAAIPMSGPPVQMHRYDWEHEMLKIDRRIYGLLSKNFPKAYSPEEMCKILGDVTLKQVWESLDSKVMRRYVFRMNQCDWNLLTEGQVAVLARLAHR